MPFRKGQSGNPAGRPAGKRVLTEVLRQAGQQAVTRNGQEVAAREALAAMVWEIATTGQVTFAGADAPRPVDPAQWFRVVGWLYQHVDGPASAEPVASERPGPAVQVYIPDNGRDAMLLPPIPRSQIPMLQTEEDDEEEEEEEDEDDEEEDDEGEYDDEEDDDEAPADHGRSGHPAIDSPLFINGRRGGGLGEGEIGKSRGAVADG